ncbi:hypothetical protein [Sphingopyxis sp. QXT-31]|uniref:hypothetical protein n=1 Tax=Sphingopyxis sp. QXT-31 TaxID=1357916 RepID=UPI0012EB6A4C|nr:hypothetical protein [Sphingopyxis sp. QXT-31]
MTVRLLTREQFDACFKAPMQRLDDAMHFADIGPYIDEVVAGEPSLQQVGDIYSIYRDALGRVDQVLLETGQDERHLVLMVDVAQATIFGHFLIDFKEEYGIA